MALPSIDEVLKKNRTSSIPSLEEVLNKPKSIQPPTFGPNVLNLEDVTGVKSTQTLEEIQRIAKQQRMGRDIPVLGNILGGLDVIQQKTEPFAKVAEELYTPGAGLSAINAGYKTAGTLVNRFLPKLDDSNALINRLTSKLGENVGGRMVQEAIKEGAVSVPVSMGQSLASGELDMKEVAKQGAIGGVFGAGVGGAVPLIGAGISNYVTPKVKEMFPNFMNKSSTETTLPKTADEISTTVEKTTPKESKDFVPTKATEFTDEGTTLAQRQKMAKVHTENPELIGSSEWKNKPTVLLKRETMERNFDDIMGKDAPAMKKKYLEPIKSSETDRVNFLNKNRDEVKALGIKYKSVDDKLVQMYGEKKITLAELKTQTKDWEKVVEATEFMRNKYDELLEEVNRALTDNGYDPIPRRKDYFPHYEEVDGMLSKLGFEINSFDLPTEIIGRTQDFKPGKNFFVNALKRKGDQTTFGFVKGFDRYIEGVSKVIHHTSNIKRLRNLESQIRTLHGDSKHLSSFVSDLLDYTNNIAGKQSAVDRGLESALGRGIYNGLDFVRRKVGLNMIGGNLASAMTNFIPVTHSLATTNKVAFANGMKDAIKNIFKNDDFVRQSKFLTRRYGSDPIAQSGVDKLVDKSMIFMRGFDRFASNIIVRSKYLEGINKGLSPSKAMSIADDWAAKMMADRSLGQVPTYFNSKAMAPILQFQVEVNNQLSFLLKDIPRNMNKKQTISALSQAMVYAYLYNEAYEKIVGRRSALDPIGIAIESFEDYTNPEVTKGNATSRLITNVLDELPGTSTLKGGRIPMSAAVPSVSNIINNPGDIGVLKDEFLKPLTHLLMPTAGGQVKKTVEGLTAMGNNPLYPQELTGTYQTNPQGEKYLKYPIEDSLINNLRVPIFGKYSPPEANEYYDNNRRPLSPKQTERLEKDVEVGRDYKQMYNRIQIERRIETLENKIKEIVKDTELTREEKTKKINKLNEQLLDTIKELRG